MFTRIILRLVSFMFASMALAAQLSVTLAVLPGSGNKSFTALHKYYMSPTGSDSNSGNSATAAWATPNHALNCGDVIIAAPGTYSPSGGFGTWGTVSHCPSTTGGIDGTGGIYFATLLCGGSDLTSCKADESATCSACVNTFSVNKDNWAIEGWDCAAGGNALCYIMDATATSITQLHHIAFVNDLAINAQQGFQENDNVVGGVGENQNVPGNGADYFAYVGDIAYHSGQSGYGVAQFNVVFPSQWDSAAGTHIFVNGNFAWNDGSISSDDGEDYMIDTPDKHGYGAKVVFSNNIGFDATRYCWALTARTNNTTFLSALKVYNLSCYGNEANVPNNNASPVAEFMFLSNGALNRPVMSFTNNLAQSSAAATSISPVPIMALYVGFGGTFSALTMTGNWWDGIATSCSGGTCNSGPPISASFFPSNTPSGTDTFGKAPGYTNVTDLIKNRTGAPKCSGFENVAQCMGYDASTATMTTPSIISDLVPTASGTAGKGYQLPTATCAANADYPIWLKGIVYLHWTGSAIVQRHGLVTTPCGL
jgi:hypothetical protein